MLTYLNNYLERLPPAQCLSLSLFIVSLLGVIDYFIGPELSFSVFYIIPIMIAGWYGGKRVGQLLVVSSAATWLYADLASGFQYSSWIVPLWNTLVRLGFFSIILALQLMVREKLELEENLAHSDPLTGLSNRRHFQDQLDRELERIQRYAEPLTVVYLDLDNFKYVNDTLGHTVGDELLKTVANTLQRNIRNVDEAARLGGDEFALLFPLLDQGAAPTVLNKLQTELLTSMQNRQWPVTFSVGAVTFKQFHGSSRDMVKMVDDLMYEVKKSGKNNIRHLAWPVASTTPKKQPIAI